MFRFFISAFYTCLLLIRLSKTDIQTKELENRYIILILLAFFGFSVKLKERFIAFCIPLLLTPFYGFGDIMIFMVLGFNLGIKRILYIIILSAIIGGIYALYILLIKKEKRNGSFPFAPCILISYFAFTIRTFVSFLIE